MIHKLYQQISQKAIFRNLFSLIKIMRFVLIFYFCGISPSYVPFLFVGFEQFFHFAIHTWADKAQSFTDILMY